MEKKQLRISFFFFFFSFLVSERTRKRISCHLIKTITSKMLPLQHPQRNFDHISKKRIILTLKHMILFGKKKLLCSSEKYYTNVEILYLSEIFNCRENYPPLFTDQTGVGFGYSQNNKLLKQEVPLPRPLDTEQKLTLLTGHQQCRIGNPIIFSAHCGEAGHLWRVQLTPLWNNSRRQRLQKELIKKKKKKKSPTSHGA